MNVRYLIITLFYYSLIQLIINKTNKTIVTLMSEHSESCCILEKIETMFLREIGERRPKHEE